MPSLSSTINILFKAQDDFSGTLGRMTSPLTTLTQSVLAADAVIIGLGATLGTIAFNESAKFEAATLNLAKVLSESDGPVSNFTDQLKQLALQYGENSNELVQSMANFKQAGFTADESAQLVKNSLDLMIAGEINAAEASELIVSALKGFGAPASEAARLVDVLNEVSNKYATDVNQLAIGMAEISPIAKTMGFSFEQTAGILTPVIEVFRSGSEASTALKTGLLRLIDDSKPVRDALESIGVAQKDANGNLRSGKDILFDVAQAFTSLDDNQKLYVATQLVGIDQAARMVQVFDNLEKSTNITADAMNAAGSAAKEVETRLASAEKASDRVKEALHQLAVSVGDEFLAEMTGVNNAITELVKSFDNVVKSGGLDPFFDLLRPQLEELENLILDVARNLPEAFEGLDFSGLVAALEGIGVEFGKIFDFDLSTTEGLRNALQLVVDALTKLAEFTSGAISGFGEFSQEIQELGRWVLSIDADTVKMVGTMGALSLTLTPMVGVIGGLSAGFLTLGGSAGALRAALGTLAGATGIGLLSFELTRLTGLDEKLNDILVPDWLAGEGATVGTAIADIVDKMTGLNEAITSTAQVSDPLEGEFRDLKNELLAFEQGVGGAAETQKDLDDQMQRVQDTFAKYGQQVDTATGEIVDITKAIDDLSGTGDKVKGSLSDQENALKHFVGTYTDANGNLQTIYKDIGEGAEESGRRVIGGYKDADGKVVPIFENIGKAANDSGDKIKKSMDEAKEASEKFRLEMEKIASNERIKLIEASVQLNIAELEADTRKVEAAFESIDVAIQSTGQLLGDLFGVFASTDDNFTKSFLRTQIEKEQERRDKALELQKDLIEQQIELIRARTNAIENGDPIIKVTADGLEPELEAFMFKILERTQVTMAAEMQQFLIGLDPQLAA